MANPKDNNPQFNVEYRREAGDSPIGNSSGAPLPPSPHLNIKIGTQSDAKSVLSMRAIGGDSFERRKGKRYQPVMPPKSQEGIQISTSERCSDSLWGVDRKHNK